MTTTDKISVAIIGSGNIGTDLMEKINKSDGPLKVGAMIGIDPNSEGLARAKALGFPISAEGIEGLMKLPNFSEIKIVFDATSAKAHFHHDKLLQEHGIRMVDLTPAAIGPFVIPVVNLEEHIGKAKNINMVTCGGQATIPIVAAVSEVTEVLYGEIVASMSSSSAGPGTRANIDEFTETTSAAIRDLGGAKRSKAIIILNPAEPPMLMRDTIYALTKVANQEIIRESIEKRIKEVQSYVPGYRLKQEVQFTEISKKEAYLYPDLKGEAGLQVTVFLEIEGAGDYLPTYAGNLDIMTAAALSCGESIARNL